MNPPGADRPPSTLLHRTCLARGEAACTYEVTWRPQPAPSRLALAGLGAALGASVVAFAASESVVWAAVPVAAVAGYLLEWNRVGRGTRTARQASAVAFRQLVARAITRNAPTAATPVPAPDPPATDHGMLALCERDGELCRLRWDGRTLVLRRTKGLELLGHLVSNPGVDIHVRELEAITPNGSSAPGPGAITVEAGTLPYAGDAGEVLDERARIEYRRRIRDLRRDLADAEAGHDLGRIEPIRGELAQLEDQVSSAVGLGGRPRRAASDTERLRVAVTKNIRKTIAHVAKRDTALGAHLGDSIRTGYTCSYTPRLRLDLLR